MGLLKTVEERFGTKNERKELEELTKVVVVLKWTG